MKLESGLEIFVCAPLGAVAFDCTGTASGIRRSTNTSRLPSHNQCYKHFSELNRVVGDPPPLRVRAPLPYAYGTPLRIDSVGFNEIREN